MSSFEANNEISAAPAPSGWQPIESQCAAAVIGYPAVPTPRQGSLDMDAGTPYGIIDPDYARIFTMARCIAWSYGYALLFHGSFTRDLDLIAVPWTKDAAEPERLVRLIVADADLHNLHEEGAPKEHGRLAWTFTFKRFGDPRFIDFSVMPRITAPAAASEVSDDR